MTGRNTTRGNSAVMFDQPMPRGGILLVELVCPVCGDRSYTVDGKCPYRESLFHQVEDMIAKEEKETGQC
jgi:hypothetical protein